MNDRRLVAQQVLGNVGDLDRHLLDQFELVAVFPGVQSFLNSGDLLVNRERGRIAGSRRQEQNLDLSPHRSKGSSPSQLFPVARDLALEVFNLQEIPCCDISWR